VELDATAYALDASTIDLCLSLFAIHLLDGKWQRHIVRPDAPPKRFK
jgi:hypothetical protein